MHYSAVNTAYSIILHDNKSKPYPLLRDINGLESIYSISPLHGRSFVVGKHNNGRYIVSKGNGLCYSQHAFLYTPEMPTDVWGLLLKEDAMRDFYCCQDVQSLGIKTNQMECVLELDYPIHIAKTDKEIKPYLLQYSVECPYRIADASFMSKEEIDFEVSKWQRYNKFNYKLNHLIAADVLLNNLYILHKNNVLHNAFTEHNHTWALELVDFELCRTPQHPYTKEDYERHVDDLFGREVIYAYVIINFIAHVLHESVDFKALDNIFSKYDFDLSKYKV